MQINKYYLELLRDRRGDVLSEMRFIQVLSEAVMAKFVATKR